MAISKAALDDALQRIGVPRVEAVLVAFLSQRDSAVTKDIVARTGLRQPEVSIGMRTLRERGWVSTEPAPRNGKGRPMHRYHLTVSHQDLRRHYERIADDSINGLETARLEIAATLEGTLQHAHAPRSRHVHGVA